MVLLVVALQVELLVVMVHVQVVFLMYQFGRLQVIVLFIGSDAAGTASGNGSPCTGSISVTYIIVVCNWWYYW